MKVGFASSSYISFVGVPNRTDSVKMGVTVGIALITCPQAEIFSLRLANKQIYMYFRFIDAILEFRLAQHLL
jgi:hypothetical protein